jgi:hypothetical protein
MKSFLTACIIMGITGLAMAGGWQAIQQDYLAGKITADERVEFAITLLTNPGNLPTQYQISEPTKDATGMIIDIETEKGNVNPSIFNRFSMLLVREPKQKVFNTPGGHFSIHYDTAGSNAVYQPTVDTNPHDGVPDYVNRTGEYFDRAWAYECDTLGYDTPPSDGTAGGGMDLFDVYMHPYSGAYGVTFPESPSTQYPGRGNDYTSYIFVDPTYNGFGYSDRTLPMKVTSAHEFFHSVQFAYNTNAGSWFMENCSTWMEDVLWDSINDNYAYLPEFMNNTHLALTTSNGAFEYGAFLWPTYLSERFGNDFIKTIWEWSIASSAYIAVNQVLDEYATGMENAYPEFATWNFLTSTRNDGQHYVEASAYRSVRIMRTHTTYPVTNNTSSYAPSTLGSNYIMFTRGSNTGRLHFTFNGNNSGTWKVVVVKSITTNQHEFDAMTIDTYGDGEIVIEDFTRFAAVTFIPCLLSGSSLNYTYSARLDTASGIADEPANLPTDFVLNGNYPNPFNGQTIISFTAPSGFAGTAQMTVYDQLGRKVSSGNIPIVTGVNNVRIDAAKWMNAASGLYFYRIAAGDKVLSGRMTYLK